MTPNEHRDAAAADLYAARDLIRAAADHLVRVNEYAAVSELRPAAALISKVRSSVAVI